MEKATCETCQSEPTVLSCGICANATCKTCAHVLEEDAFSFLPEVPEHLTKGIYCNQCFEAKVAADVAEYELKMKAAGQLDLYFKNQGKETRFVRRHAAPFVVKECVDRDELLLRLAFLAVHGGFKCLVDVEVTGLKVTNHAYQKLVFSGHGDSGQPATSPTSASVSRAEQSQLSGRKLTLSLPLKW